jgi:preprotein translocase subunit SecD
MLNLARWKVISCLAALLFGLVFSLPNMLPAKVMEQVPAWLPHQKLNLGLDLQGGSYLLLEVDTPALKKERLANLLEDVRGTLRTDQIAFTGLGQVNDVISVRITDQAQLDAARKALNGLGQPLPGAPAGRDLKLSVAADQRIELSLVEEAVSAEAAKAVEQSIEIIRRRIDALGTREPTIIRQGTNRIVVQAPGESDPERLKRVIGQTAKLTFQMVDDSVTMQEVAAGRVPPGSEVLPSEEPSEPALLVKRRAVVDGGMLTDARLSFDQTGQPVVSFRFNSQGGRRFGDATADNTGKRFAIVLDGKIISAPRINEPIRGGSGQISGNFTEASANDLAVLLRAGALPAPLKVEEQRTVGAELGADAVKAGQFSTLLGAGMIFIFIILAYGLFGTFAAAALVVNGLLIVALMSVTQATLTLPGIAGLILTLAVAVDANVLIYERMRDEVRAGRSPIAAADAGYSKAMVTIIDANVTTILAALIMFQFGSGPVRGFAWTLSIGVITSVFTSVLITQVLIAWWFRVVRPKKLPIV